MADSKFSIENGYMNSTESKTHPLYAIPKSNPGTNNIMQALKPHLLHKSQPLSNLCNSTKLQIGASCVRLLVIE